MAEHELIAGLEAAVAATPGNVALRLHLVEHLVAANRGPEALAHCEAILRAQPDNAQAAAGAARAAQVAGDTRAPAFGRLAAALEAAITPAPAHGETAAPAAASPVAVAAPAAAPVSGLPSIGDAAPAESVTPPAAVQSPAPVADEAVETESQPDVEETAEDVAPEPDTPREFAIDPQSIQRPTLSFRNIIGVSDVKQRIQSVVLDPLRTRGRSPGQAVSAQGGYLMFGPPGCGKGFFARVVAGEIGAAFLPINLGRALEWPGDPRQNIQKIFEAAREAAPCVVFLDEVDMAGRHPDAPDDPIDRGVVNRLSTELDSAAAHKGIFVFGGAVLPWDVDMALRAENRLDRTLLVLPPDEAAREAILRFHLKNTRLAGVDVGWIVQRTQHFSGDDLLLLCETAMGLAAGDGLGGEPTIGPGHVTRALRDVRPSAPAWFSAALEHAGTSNHGGIYDEVIAYIDEHQLV